MTTDAAPGLRIGALAERVGATETVLRVWERRYGLFDPARTAGGYRLYGPEDERRALAMVRAREAGVPAAQAAAAILAAERRAPGTPSGPGGPGEAGPAGEGGGGLGSPAASAAGGTAGEAGAAGWVADLLAATARFDDVASHRALDRAFASVSVEAVVRDVLMPFLAAVGTGWADGTVTVEHEHFASDLVRGRLTALGAGLGAGTGPTVLLACLPGERHELGLKAFELVALRAGCRTRYLGADTPLASIEGAAARVQPDLVVLAATSPEHFAAAEPALRSLAARHLVALAGAGADAALAERVGARWLDGDPVAAARHLRGLRPRAAGRPVAGVTADGGSRGAHHG